MTTLEAIIGSLYPYAVDEALILKTCVDLDINEADEYETTLREKVARATIHILQNLATLSSENNGGRSASYDVAQLKNRIYCIASFHGLSDVVAEFDTRTRITDKSEMW